MIKFERGFDEHTWMMAYGFAVNGLVQGGKFTAAQVDEKAQEIADKAVLAMRARVPAENS